MMSFPLYQSIPLMVFGSRHLTLTPARTAQLDLIHHLYPQIRGVIHGGCRGIDVDAGVWARGRGLPVEVFPADWAQFGRAAGPKRNEEMVRRAGIGVGFWDGMSRGTQNSIQLFAAAGKPCIVFV